MENKFCILHGHFSWFETSPTFLTNQCTYEGISFLKEVFPGGGGAFSCCRSVEH